MNTGLIVGFVVVGLVVLVIAGFFFLRRRPSESITEVTGRRPPTISLASRLSKTRDAFTSKLSGLLGGPLDESFWQGLEETLISADVGPVTSARIVKEVRAAKPENGTEAREALRDQMVAGFDASDRSLHMTTDPSVILIVGVNGTGKTTSIAKLTRQLQNEGKRVVLGAADTFRAGAIEQLRMWADRLDATFVGAETGADPASVAFRAFEEAKTTGSEVVIVDTAGRLHNNKNLMAELSKVVRVLDREAGGIDNVLLVVDATTGQNGVTQAEAFVGVAPVNGIILTKMDGTAKGGVVAAIEHETGVPVRFIGVGETMDDLLPFEPPAFVDALLE